MQVDLRPYIGKSVAEALVLMERTSSILLKDLKTLSDHLIIEESHLDGAFSIEERWIRFKILLLSGKLSSFRTLTAKLGQTFEQIFGIAEEDVCLFCDYQNIDLKIIPDSVELDQYLSTKTIIHAIKTIAFRLNIVVHYEGATQVTQTSLDFSISDFEFQDEHLMLTKTVFDSRLASISAEGVILVTSDDAILTFPVSFFALKSSQMKVTLSLPKKKYELNELTAADQAELDFYVQVASYSTDLIVGNLSCLAKKINLQAKELLYSTIRPFELDMNLTFIWVVAPAGTGKTQLSYTLDQNGCPLVRLVMGGSDQDQRIYRTSQLSQLFRDAIKRETLEILTLHPLYSSKPADAIEDMKSCAVFLKFWDRKLDSVGILNYALRNRLNEMNPQNFIYEAMSPQEFYRSWRTDIEKLPCICLDEFSLSGPDSNEMIFARNLCRALGIVTFVMGTDSSAANVINTIGIGRKASTVDVPISKRPWVYVVHQLPEIKKEALPSYEKYYRTIASLRKNPEWIGLFEWLEGVPTKRARFLRIAFEALTEYFIANNTALSVLDALDYILKAVNTKCVEGKFGLNSETDDNWHVFGQIASLFPRWSSRLPDLLIHKYFADIVPPEDITDKDLENGFFPLFRNRSMVNNKLKLSRTESTSREDRFWDNPKSSLPSVHEEQLGTLALITGHREVDNVFTGSGCSLWYGYLRIYFSKVAQGNTTKETLSLLKQHEGHVLENLAHLALIYASSRYESKWSGSRIDTASLEIISLMARSDMPVKFKLSEDCMLAKLCDKMGNIAPRLPVLGPIGHDYGFVREIIRNAAIGSLFHCEDKEQIDGIIYDLRIGTFSLISGWIFTAECKNICKELSAALLRSIMNKSWKLPQTPHDIPSDSKRVTYIFANQASKPVQLRKGECVFTCVKEDDTVSFKGRFWGSKTLEDVEVEEIRMIVIVFSLQDIFGEEYTVDLRRQEQLALEEISKAAKSEISASFEKISKSAKSEISEISEAAKSEISASSNTGKRKASSTDSSSAAKRKATVSRSAVVTRYSERILNNKKK